MHYLFLIRYKENLLKLSVRYFIQNGRANLRGTIRQFHRKIYIKLDCKYNINIHYIQCCTK